MRVLQLIDSLRPGGAEQMAVSYANALAKRIEGSSLCCTRKEGLLKNRIAPKVEYLFLEKKRTIDLRAFLKLRSFVKENQISLIQAHSSSWFLALMVKMSLPHVKLVWHDHFGRQLETRNVGTLNFASKFFDGIISVNEQLEMWAKKKLLCSRVRFFRNFVPERENSAVYKKEPNADLKFSKTEINIIHLANLRPQKDHLNLLKAFLEVRQRFPDLLLHLVGKDLKDHYSVQLKNFIKDNNLQKFIVLHGEQENVQDFLINADIAVLSSRSEGLPVALLEYGLAGLPVICTDVGDCAKVLGGHGEIVQPEDTPGLANALLGYITKEQQRQEQGRYFQARILRLYSEDAVIPGVIVFFKDLWRTKSTDVDNIYS